MGNRIDPKLPERLLDKSQANKPAPFERKAR